MKAIVVAAGYGTRFLPVTKTVPKEMLPLVDRPAIDFLLDELEASGIRQVLIVTSRRKRALEDYLDREVELEGVFHREGASRKLEAIRPRNLDIAFVRQSEMRGTGHALLETRPWVGDDPVVVAYPDDLHRGERPLSLQLIEEYRRTGDTVLAVMDMDRDLERYGVVAWDGDSNRITTLVEKPKPGTAPSRSVSIGRYLYTPDFFEALEDEYRRHIEGEFYHVGALQRLMARGRVRGVRMEGERWDTGEPLGYLEASLRYALERPDLRPALTTLLERLLQR